MADAATITSSLFLRDALVCMSSLVPTEDELDVMTLASTAALEQALAIPALTISDIRAKLAALIDDAGCGLVEVEGLDFIMRDLDALAGRAVQ